MTMIIDHRRTSRTHRAFIWLDAQLSRAAAALARLHQANASRRTAREIAGLPLDLRKDIGWPAQDLPARGKR